jgi:zinc protease
MEVFADLVHNPSFPDDEVNATRQRVEAAIASQDNNWRTGGMRYFRKVFFGPRRSPYQFTTLGTTQNLEKFSPDDLNKWYRDKVLAGRWVMAIYGDIDVESARKVATRYFGEHRPRQSPAAAGALRIPPSEQGTPSITVEDVKVQKWDNPETAVFIGFASDSIYADPQREPLIMADTLTSGYTYPTGYIFETLRGMGLVYDANAQNIWGVSAKLPGTFFAYAACDPTNADACIDQILLNIARLQGSEKDIDLDWFARAQNLVTSVDAMENETAASQAATAALDEMYGVGYDFHAGFAKRIHAVTPQQVRDVARARLRHCVIAVSTSQPELLKAKPGTRRYTEFPPVDLAPQGVQHDTGSAAK